MSRLFGRIWRISLLEAVIVSAPVLAFLGWVCFQAYGEYTRYAHYVETVTGERIPLSQSVARTYLSDTWYRLWHRALLPPVDSASPLRTVDIEASPRDLDAMIRQNLSLKTYVRGQGVLSDQGDWAKGRIRVDGEAWVDGKLRLRGDHPNHWLYPQKSLRVKLRPGDLLGGVRTFNLINPRFAMMVGELIVSEYARGQGLLAPRMEPVRVTINGASMGVYFFMDQIDEGFLRHSKRMPGSIYYGDGGGLLPNGMSSLFHDADRWVKKASRNAEKEADRSDIDALMQARISLSSAEFRRWAELHADVDRFLAYSALDNLFGIAHHDNAHNHKLYFDPYRGRVEPVYWDWGMPQAFQRMDAVVDPLTRRFLEHPDWVARRNALVLDMARQILDEETGLRTRFEAWRDRLEPEVALDPFLDAGHVGRPADVRYAHFSRPLTPGEQAEADEVALGNLEQHARWLVEELTHPASLTLGWDAGAGGAQLVIDVDGRTAVTLESVVAPDGAVARPEPAGTGGAAPLATGAGAERPLLLHPGTYLVPREVRDEASMLLFGDTDVVPGPLRYVIDLPGLQLEEGAALTVVVRDRSTGMARSLTAPQGVAPHAPPGLMHGVHPWTWAPPDADPVRRFGPGVVAVAAANILVVGAGTRTEIAPGTEFRMGADASLVLLGPVHAVGTRELPIRFVPADDAPWGGVALQGPGTSGARLAHWDVRGGTRPTYAGVDYTGMVNVHDTRNVSVADSRFTGNTLSDDALHVAYVHDFELLRVTTENVPGDGVDIDISSGVVHDSRFLDAVNDGLDLMTSEVAISSSEFARCGDKGLSVGEASTVLVAGSTFADCLIGVQIKDASFVEWSENRLLRCEVGVDLYVKNDHYGVGGMLRADELDAEDCRYVLVYDKDSSVEIASAGGSVASHASPKDVWGNPRP